eukprot:1152806-Pelagomonas_calceolata.AAC.2
MNIDIDGAYLTFPDTLNCAQFKYIITIDGLAGSNRDLALLHMGSVLIKQYRSPYLEWYYNSIKPGLQLFSASTCAGVNLGQQYQSWTMTETFQQYCLPCKVQEAFLLQLAARCCQRAQATLMLDPKPAHLHVCAGVHYEEVFKPRPDGSVNADDALDLVDRLRSDDAYARSLAENGLAFARNYLTAEVMFVYLRELLLAYKDLFEDMDAYLSHYPPDTGSSALFTEHARAWQTAPWKAGQR